MKVFITRKIPEAGLKKLRDYCDVDIWPGDLPPSQDILKRKVIDCEGLLSLVTDKIDENLMNACLRLKVISNMAVGYNNIDIESAKKRGILVGNTPDVLTDATADLAVTLILASGRRIVESARSVRDGHWQTWEPLGHVGLDFKGKTIGIVGMGRIGFAVAQRFYGGWNMEVLYASRTSKPEAERRFSAKKVSLEELLKKSDFVSTHVDLNETTKGLFCAKTFSLMKPGSIFVNTARGPIHVEADLYDVLKSGHLFAAALDVTDPEPMAPDHPLLSLDNCIVVPHIASATIQTRNRMAELAADNIIAALSGRTMPARVV